MVVAAQDLLYRPQRRDGNGEWRLISLYTPASFRNTSTSAKAADLGWTAGVGAYAARALHTA